LFGFKRKRTTTGREGENLAARFLKKQGCKILRRNCRSKFGEIDILVRDGDEVVFVEVKTLRSSQYGTPAHNLTTGQIRRIRLAAERIVNRASLHDYPLRFDVITVVLPEDGQPEIKHYKDAFEA
jgi:putative endonuclease